MKKFFNEFKEFALKGNALDMAIGIIIGAGFNTIVSSLVNDVFSPVIGVLISNVDLSKLNIILKQSSDETISLNYGSFIQSVINFIIVALVAFLVVKSMNRIKAKIEAEKNNNIIIEENKESLELVELKKITKLLTDITDSKSNIWLYFHLI